MIWLYHSEASKICTERDHFSVKYFGCYEIKKWLEIEENWTSILWGFSTESPSLGPHSSDSDPNKNTS